MNNNESISDIECPICFESIDDSNLVVMNCCKQKIHSSCLNQWVLFKKDNRCILCRGNNNIIVKLISNDITSETQNNYDRRNSYASLPKAS